MGPLDRIADRSLGYLGLFLIGAISWMADRMGPVTRPEPGVPTRMVRRTPAPAGRLVPAPLSPGHCAPTARAERHS
jgi:hypothetical protein